MEVLVYFGRKQLTRRVFRVLFFFCSIDWDYISKKKEIEGVGDGNEENF